MKHWFNIYIKVFKKINAYRYDNYSFSYGLEVNNGDNYTITWEDCGCNLVSLNLQNKLNDDWINTSVNSLNYLSIIADSEPNYYLWNIPENIPSNTYRVNIIDVDLNKIISSESFDLKSTLDTSTTKPHSTPEVLDEYTTIKTTIFIQEPDELDNKKTCFNEISCYPVITVIIIALLIFLCCIIKCCC